MKFVIVVVELMDTIQSELYLHLSYFSNMVRKFDRIYNFSVFQCTKEIKDENTAVHPEFSDEK